MAKQNNQYKAAVESMSKSIEKFPDSINSSDDTLMCDLFEGNGMPEVKKKPVNLALAKIRHTKKLMRETLNDILNIEDEDGDSNLEIILSALVDKAKSGDLKAIELIAKILNEVADTKVDVNFPEIKIVVDNNNNEGIRFTEVPEDIDSTGDK